MIRRGRTRFAEESAAIFMRAQITTPGRDILACHLPEPFKLANEAGGLGIEHGIGTIGSDHASGPPALANRLVMIERVERAFGGGDELDVEALEQGARAKAGGL